MAQEKLTVKQRRFIDEYIICLNGTEAARRAGYDGNDATLANTASENLRKPYILREIEQRLENFAMSANEVLIHLTDIARGDMGSFMDSAGIPDPTEAKRQGKSHLIKKIKTKTTYITDDNGDGREIHETEFEVYDRMDALKTLAKYHALLTDRLSIDTWEDRAIADLKSGLIPADAFEDMVNALNGNRDLVTQLFTKAGIKPVLR